ncbi:MAG: lipid-A-disaccharide synthase-related protein [Vulcanimicrobiaceae bacterium]
MKRVLFVSNGHGEEAIAGRIAADLAERCTVECDHLALVGDFGHPSSMHQVGPRRSMPSGGLIAMGNLANMWRDLRSGLVVHTISQLRFLHTVRGVYDCAIAVGDTFALLMAKRARARRTVFVGTAKSVYVAPYGKGEQRILTGADAVFVRDEQTAEHLRAGGIAAQAPGNVIVDLFAQRSQTVPFFAERLAIFPGSRQSAYEDAVFLCGVVRDVATRRPELGATLSIAPGLDAQQFAMVLEADGWQVRPSPSSDVPFCLCIGERTVIAAWSGPPGAMLSGAIVVLGQAGTANEAAAADGIPVVAFEQPGARQHGWYRMRQRGLLGEAMRMIQGDVPDAARALELLLEDAPARAAMGTVGRQRMGAPGGSKAIAAKIAVMVEC